MAVLRLAVLPKPKDVSRQAQIPFEPKQLWYNSPLRGIMKKNLVIISTLIALCLWLVAPVGAQTATNQLSQVQIDLWPDLDRPSVLVLITAELPADAPLPSTLEFKLPVEPSAVASVNAAGDMLNTPYSTESDAGVTTVTVESNERTIRVEYYFPYQQTGNQIEFEYQWLGGPAVDDLLILFREPNGSTAVTTESQFENVGPLSDEQPNHSWQVGSVEVGQSVSAAFGYTAAPPAAVGDSSVNQPGSQEATADLTLIILAALGGLFVGAGAMWFWQNQRTTVRPRQRAPKASRTGFCHQCGSSLKSGDVFCRQCGAKSR